MIHVCSLARLHDTVARDRRAPCRDAAQGHRPGAAARPASRRTTICCSAWTTSPTRSTAMSRRPTSMSASCCASCARWDRAQPLVVHCYAGISRSTAGAFITACALNPQRDETDDRAGAARASPTAMPNLPHRRARRPHARPRRPHGRGGRGDRPRHARPIEASRSGSISSDHDAMAEHAIARDRADRDRADRRDRRGRGRRAGDPGRRRRRQGRDARRPAVRPVRSAGAPHLRDRPARLGRGADRPARRLCRAALHVRRSRPPCAARRHRPAHGLDRLSRAHPHARQRRARCARPAPASSRGTASFRGRTGARSGPRSSTRRSCRCSANGPAPPHGRSPAARSAGASGCGSASASAAAPWDEEKVLDRYELLYEAGLVEEARRDGREAALARATIAGARRADALRPSPHPRDRDRAAARQAEISAGGVRADAAPNSR